MKKSLAIVVLTWNDFKNTIKCIKSIYPQLNNNNKLILVDNNSDDEIFNSTLQWIKNKYPKKYFYLKVVKKYQNSLKKKKIFIIRNKKNLGCGTGHNIGYKFALNNNFEFISRIDNDMKVSNIFFKKLLKNFEDENVLGVSPKIMYTKKPKKIWWMGTTIGNSLKFQTQMRTYPYNLEDSKLIKGIVNTDAIAGCASIMRSSRLRKVGLSDPEFFYGPEDVEFSRRIFSKSGSLIVDRDVKIYHGVTQSFINYSKRKTYYEYKYRLLLIKKIGNFYDKFFGYSISIIKFILHLIFHENIILNYSIFTQFYIFSNKLGSFIEIIKFFKTHKLMAYQNILTFFMGTIYFVILFLTNIKNFFSF